ncbi:uncharacterized protein [Palaemon carinicauda]|uniref:uncharacterized protein n=1 Tax=Palaemon carinicauda TaxID=392227 RepID=UPI0035B67AAF
MRVESLPQNEFTCNNGTCLDLSRRCDGENDCGDDSDENCTVIRSLPTSYRSYRPHLKRTPLDVQLNISKIVNVDVDLGLIQLQIQTESAWKDDRISLVQLRNNSRENNLPKEIIWVPSYRLPNAVFEDAMSYFEWKNVYHVLTAVKVGIGKTRVVNSYEGYEYKGGRDAYISLLQTFTSSFDCNFDLKLFPFDVHICDVTFSLSHNGEYLAYFNTSAIKVDPSNFTLSLYTTRPVCYTHDTEMEHIYDIKIQRQKAALLLRWDTQAKESRLCTGWEAAVTEQATNKAAEENPKLFTWIGLGHRENCAVKPSPLSGRGKNSITRILLERRYGAYVFTTFLPCSLLGMIGGLTQFFAYENFSDRIMVTLSCLIVVAALFSQVAVTVPASAQPKIIDIFFFYCMIRLFVIFLHHTILFLLQVCVKKRNAKREAEERVHYHARNIKNVTDQLTYKGRVEVTEQATYNVPAKESFKLNAWDLASHATVKKRNNTVMSCGKKAMTMDKIFNVLGIIFSYTLDITWFSVFSSYIYNHNWMKIQKFENDCIRKL